MDERDAIDWSDLFEERNLWQIYLKSGAFYKNKFNAVVFVASILLFTGFCIERFIAGGGTIEFLPSRPEDFDFAGVFTNWATVGITFAATILGFLIAGFAVFFAVLQPDTALRLRLVPKRKGESMDELKLLLVNFVALFAHYGAFLFWCFLYLAAGGRNGLFEIAGHYLGQVSPAIPRIVTGVVFVAWSTWMIVLILKLKGFIFNLYHALLLAIADRIPEADS